MDKQTKEELRDDLARISADLDQAQSHLNAVRRTLGAEDPWVVEFQAKVDQRRGWLQRMELSLSNLPNG